MNIHNNHNTVLIIDDNEGNIKLLTETLEQYGFETITACNGTMGLKQAKFAQPDLILLDIMMPDMDGFETCRLLKANQTTQNTPVIFLTANNNTANKVKGFELGAVDYITKPFETAEIIARVNKHLTIYDLQKKLAEKNRQLEAEIIERKRVEQQLQEKTLYLDNILHSSKAYAIITTDLEARIIYYNPMAETLFGLPATKVIGYTLIETGLINKITADPLEKVIEIIHQHGEYLHIMELEQSTTLSYINSRISGIYNTDNQLVGFAIFSRDISAQKQIEQARKAQNKFLHTIIDSLDNPFYVINVHDYSIEIANAAARELGINTSNTCYFLTHHRDTPCNGLEHPCPLIIIQHTKKPTVVEHIHYDKQGNPINVEVHGYPILDETGEVVQMIEYSLDITSRKQTEEQLRKLSRAVEQSGSTIVITDLKGNIEFVNPTFSKITGYSQAEIMGQTPRVLKSGKMSPEIYEELWQTIKRGEVWQGEMINRKKNGELYWEYATISPVKDRMGKTTHYVAVKDDITDRKKSQEALQQAYDELELRVDELGTLNLIMQILTTMVELTVALQLVTKTMTKLFNASQCGIALLNDDHTELVVTAEYTQNSNKSGLTNLNSIGLKILVADNPAVLQAISKRQSVMISQPQTNPLSTPMHDLMRERHSECFLVVPLLTRGDLLGTIGIHTDIVGREFTIEETKLAETIAGQIAGVIENSWLLEAEKKAREATELANTNLSDMNKHLQILNNKMQDELSLAREIQYSLLPSPNPDWLLDVLCFTTPARAIGGDFYTYHQFTSATQPSNEHYAVAIGDVSGKGVSAALLMAASLSKLEALFAHDYSPIQRLTYLDEAIMHYTKPRQQNCALCYVELAITADRCFAQLTVINAGCIPPYIKRREGMVEQPEIGGFALGEGLSTEFEYQPHICELQAGDMVILVSDGVVEAKNNIGEMLSFERLEQIIRTSPIIKNRVDINSSEIMLNHIKQAVFTFTQEAEQHDDMTIVVIQI